MNRYVLAVAMCVAPLAVAQDAPPEGASQGVEGRFGLRASFAGSPNSPAGGASVPTLGIKYFVSDDLGLVANLGLTLSFAGSTLLPGFDAAVGIEYHLVDSSKKLRPFFFGGTGFGKPASGSGDDFVLLVATGFGAEYWLSKNLSFWARMQLAARIAFASGAGTAPTTMVISTPALGASLYFD